MSSGDTMNGDDDDAAGRLLAQFQAGQTQENASPNIIASDGKMVESKSAPLEKKKRGGRESIDKQEYSDQINRRMGRSGDREIDFTKLNVRGITMMRDAVSDDEELLKLIPSLVAHARPELEAGRTLLPVAQEAVKGIRRKLAHVIDPDTPQKDSDTVPILGAIGRRLFGKKQE